MANEAAIETQTVMRKLFAGYWVNSQRPEVSISASLLHLAETLERKLTDKQMKTYLAVLADLTREENVQAFSRAATECKFFPPPAVLLELSGRPTTSGDPLANEAKAELFKIVAAMRGPHGPKLRPILGELIHKQVPRNAEGEVLLSEIDKRHPSTPFLLSRRTEAALLRLGWGDRTTGIALIAEHPIVAGRAESDDDRYQTNRMRAADDLLAKWIAVYREVSFDPAATIFDSQPHQGSSYRRRQDLITNEQVGLFDGQ
jgi:hypothetical protein